MRVEGFVKLVLTFLRRHGRTGEVFLLLRSHVACVSKPSQNKNSLGKSAQYLRSSIELV